MVHMLCIKENPNLVRVRCHLGFQKPISVYDPIIKHKHVLSYEVIQDLSLLNS
jgi:hypothetical protein